MHIRDPLQMSKMFDSLVRPNLSLRCKIWALNPKAGEEAGMLHKSFLHSLLLRPKKASESGAIVLAHFLPCPLQHSWWQQIVRYQNRLTNMIHMHDSKSWYSL